MKLLRWTLVLAALANAACTTSLVNAGREDAAHPMRELGDMQRPLQGALAGRATLAEQQYVRIVIPAAREACGRDEALELLLPVSPDGSSILREAASAAQGALGPNVTLYGASYSGSRPPIEERRKVLDWLGALPVPPDGISPVVVEHEGRMGLKASYKTGEAGAAARSTVLEMQSSWICRSHAKHALMVALYVPAVALDIVTAPIQIGLFLLTMH
jgi:hypothetical protein